MTMSELTATRLSATPYRIAKIAGVSVSHTVRVLKGETHARLDMAVKIAQAAGITVDQLAERVYGRDPEMVRAVAEINKRRKANQVSGLTVTAVGRR
jgi:transcriptional regulator with XRE-family HTH domain